MGTREVGELTGTVGGGGVKLRRAGGVSPWRWCCGEGEREGVVGENFGGAMGCSMPVELIGDSPGTTETEVATFDGSRGK